MLARCLICNNEVSLTLSVADRYDALSIIQRLLSTPAARLTQTEDAVGAVGGSPEAAPRPRSRSLSLRRLLQPIGGEVPHEGLTFILALVTEDAAALCVERVLSPKKKTARDVFKIEIIVFTGRRVAFSLCRQQTMKRREREREKKNCSFDSVSFSIINALLWQFLIQYVNRISSYYAEH